MLYGQECQQCHQLKREVDDLRYELDRERDRQAQRLEQVRDDRRVEEQSLRDYCNDLQTDLRALWERIDRLEKGGAA